MTDRVEDYWTWVRERDAPIVRPRTVAEACAMSDAAWVAIGGAVEHPTSIAWREMSFGDARRWLLEKMGLA